MHWHFGPFRLDLANACLWHAAQPVTLRPKTFAVLVYLVTHAGQLVTKEALFDAVWPVTAVGDGVLKTSMTELRKALGERANASQWIATVHRRGYRFVAPVTLLESAPPPAVLPSPVVPLPAPVSVPTPAPRLVAREAENATLHQWFATALQGERHLGFITGEAGIGKTTLVDTFVAQLAGQVPLWLGRGQCIEQYSAGEAYLPLLEALGQMGRTPDGPQVVALLRQQAPSWLLQLPALLAPGEYEALQRYADETTRERMLRELAEAMEALTALRPCVLVLEDLHWSDTATIEWLAYMARRRGPTRLLVLGTYRPVEAIVRAHPVRAMVQELLVHGYGAELALEEWAEAGVAAYLVQRGAGATVPAALARMLTERTDGHPLFVVALVDELLRQRVLRVEPMGWVVAGGLDAVTVGAPPSIRHLLEQQVTQRRPAEQELLAAASVAGVEFAVAAVAAGVQQTGEDVEVQCDILARQSQLVQARGTAVWPDGTVTARYGFRHALYQELLYERVPVSRRVRWHQQIGMRLERAFGPRANEVAAELAVHFAQGRDYDRAVQYLQYTAETAIQRHAQREAMASLRQALELLTALPDTPERARQELTLLIALGATLAATKGYGNTEVERVYSRARELCQQLGETIQLFPVQWGLWTCYIVQAKQQRAREVGTQLLSLSQHVQDATFLLEAHLALAGSLHDLGEFTPARHYWDHSLACYDRQQHRSHIMHFGMDLGVFSRAWMAHTLWHLGYPDQALTRSHEAFALAEEHAHPFSQAIALAYAVMVHQFRREQHTIDEHAVPALALCTEQGFAYYLAWVTIVQGWSLAVQGQQEAGIEQMRQGLAALQSTGAKRALPYYLALLAEGYGAVEQADEGLRVLAEAFTAVATTAERRWEAELYRLQGELLLQAPSRKRKAAETPEACFRRALGVARQQQAKSLELRAAMSLSRLWLQQGKPDAARHILPEVYARFSEGLDTVDLQEARALLAQLA